jgi:hypothetical protein
MLQKDLKKILATMVLYIVFVLNLLIFFLNHPGVMKLLGSGTPAYTYKETPVVYFQPAQIHLVETNESGYVTEDFIASDIKPQSSIKTDLFSLWSSQNFTLENMDATQTREYLIVGNTDISKKTAYLKYEFNYSDETERFVEVGLSLHFPLHAFDINLSEHLLSFKFDKCSTEVQTDGTYLRSDGQYIFFVPETNQITFEVKTKCN